MSETGDEMVAFRLSPNDRAAIQRLVEKGEFRNRSDFLRYAVKTALRDMDRNPTLRTKMDLELEGVNLPEQAARTQRAAPRTRKGVNL